MEFSFHTGQKWNEMKGKRKDDDNDDNHNDDHDDDDDDDADDGQWRCNHQLWERTMLQHREHKEADWLVGKGSGDEAKHKQDRSVEDRQAKVDWCLPSKTRKQKTNKRPAPNKKGKTNKDEFSSLVWKPFC